MRGVSETKNTLDHICNKIVRQECDVHFKYLVDSMCS